MQTRVQDLKLEKVGSRVAHFLSLVYKLTRQPIVVVGLDINNKIVREQIVALEKRAYKDAAIDKRDFEGHEYFKKFSFGLNLVGSVHLGICDTATGELIGYMAFFQPKPGQWLRQTAGEFLFTPCQEAWESLGKPIFPIIVYRKLMRDPGRRNKILLYRSGALRVPLGLITLAVSRASYNSWFLITRAQPDSVRVLKTGIETVFPQTKWLVEVPDGVTGVRITMCVFESLHGIARLPGLFRCLVGILAFAKMLGRKASPRRSLSQTEYGHDG